MFVALTAAESGRIFGGVLNILTKPKARIEAREALGAVYGVIVAALPLRAPDWRRVAALADRYADRMLLPAGLEAPPPIAHAAFPRYERHVLLQTAVEIVKRTRMPMYRRVAGLVDATGEYSDFLYPLLSHYTSVKVITKRPALYEAQSERMMRELGASVMLRDDYSSLDDCVLIIAPDGVDTRERLKCPVLSGKPPAENQPSDFITDLRVAAPHEVLRLCPEGIEPHLFFAALYEYCGVEHAGFVATRMMFRYREDDLSGVVRAVMEASGTLTLF